MFEFIIFGKSLRPKYCLKIESNNVKESDHVELLGITVNKHLSFKNNLRREFMSECKLHSLRRMRKCFNCRKSQTASYAFIDSHFSYALLIWMFCQNKFFIKMQGGDYISWASSFVAQYTTLHHFKTNMSISSKLCWNCFTIAWGELKSRWLVLPCWVVFGKRDRSSHVII